jgi:membrane protease YdiL (CAAX protease family)
MFGEYHAYGVLAVSTVAYAALGVGAMVWSRKMDDRNVSSIGLGWKALREAVPWVIVGLVASSPTIVTFLSLAPGWVEMAGEALIVLVPATVVQAGAEEIIFRGVLLASLAARYGPARGLLYSAALFAFWHVYVGQPLPDLFFRAGTTFVFGVIAGLLALRQGHLGGVIALHVVWNVFIDLAGGFEGWPEQFWTMFVLHFRYEAPLTTWDDQTVRATLLSLIIETVLVLAATRTTFRQIFDPLAVDSEP